MPRDLACFLTRAALSGLAGLLWLPGRAWAQSDPRQGQRAVERLAIGILADAGGEVELRPSCSEFETVRSCSNLFFWRLDAGAAWRFAPLWELLVVGGYGWSGETDVTSHRRFRVGIGGLRTFRFGIFEPAIGIFAGMLVAIDTPRAGLGFETQEQYAPFAGVEAPMTLVISDFTLALVPGLSAQAVATPPPEAAYARDYASWSAGVVLRAGYYVSLGR